MMVDSTCSNALLYSSKYFIAITAYNPLKRFDPFLEVLRGYEELPGTKEVFVFIDHEHREDKDTLTNLISSNVKGLTIEVIVAPEEYKGFSLTWSHKNLLRLAVEAKAYDFYIYTENDMLFSSENFFYWFNWKDKLKPLNLEPGFCRFERFEDKFVPFDNHRQWQLNTKTPEVWGDRPYRVETYLTPYSEFVGFASLGNPYGGLMVLDQQMAEEYIRSDSFDPTKSYELTRHRCWPIADRSSMGTIFENLRPGQEHRRVVPLIASGGSVQIAPCGMLEHLDTKYSKELSERGVDLLDISKLLVT